MTEKTVRQIRSEMIDKAAFIFVKVFGEIQVPGVKNMLDFMGEIWGPNFINQITLEVSKNLYKDHINWLIDKRRLHEYVEKIIENNYDGYFVLNSDTKQEIVLCRTRIAELTNELKVAEKRKPPITDVDEDITDSTTSTSTERSDLSLQSGKLDWKQMVGGAMVLVGTFALGFLAKQTDDEAR